MGMLKKMSDKARDMLLDNGMVEWLMKNEGFSEAEAVEWIDYNTIRALSYMGSDAPIVMYHLI